jgi:hypothetical protein
VALVVCSVVVGARALSAADDRAEVWSLTAALAAGTTLTSDDLALVPVGLDDAGAYLDAAADPAGLVLLRDVGAGELLPAAAAGERGSSARRLVTVAVDPLHAPPALARGERVDVWVTPPDGAAADGAGALPVLVLAGALVADPGAADSTGLTDQVGVVLDVSQDDAERAVAAARSGDVDLVRLGG